MEPSEGEEFMANVVVCGCTITVEVEWDIT
jgi:hypothetical protein